jgi:hypothetical protein
MPGTQKTRKIAWGRFATIATAVALGASAAIWGQPLLEGNSSAPEIIVTAFSILAGFLIAIMTIIGDPAGFSGRTWRFQQLAQNSIHKQLWRQTWLFVLYLATLCLIFVASLISTRYPGVKECLERVYLGLAVAALVMSFRLPFTLKRIQLERHEEAIRSRMPRNGGDADRVSERLNKKA